jgi:aminopeptidase
LGEIALVPHQSPISNANVIFYNTLYDENASCHLAIGSALAFNIEGGSEMTKEEMERNGANTSLTHVDFMIGSAELDIDGETQDGRLEPLFRKGNWAI